MFKPKGILLVLFFIPLFLLGNEVASRLLDSAVFYRYIDDRKMDQFLEEAFQHLDSENDQYYLGRYYCERGYNSILHEDFDKAFQDLALGKDMMTDYKDSILYLRISHTVANAYFLNGQYNQALNNYLEIISFIRADLHPSLKLNEDYRRVEGYCLKNIGVVEYVVFAEQKAIDYYKKSAVIFEDIEEYQMVKYAFYSIAGCYLEQDNIEQSKFYIDKARAIDNTYSEEIELGDFYLTEGYYFFKINQIDSADSYFTKSWDIYSKYGDDFGLSVCKVHQAELLLKLQDNEGAEQFLEQSYTYLIENGEGRILLKVQKLLAEVYHNLGKNEKAFKLIEATLETQDHILKNSELFFSYETENKVALSNHIYSDSLTTVSNNFKINQFKSELNEKSLYNRLLFVIVLFFVILTPLLFLLLKKNRKSNRVLQESLDEKKVLFQEVHHRVKNNFQIISSLMNLQMQNSKDERLDELLKETQHRIISMAFVHELLYRSNKFDEIDMQFYVNELVPSIIYSFSSEKVQIDFTVETNDILLNLNQAIPIGLILNEIITNSVKYAFVGREKGLIEVEILLTELNEMILKIKDDGIGIADDLQQENESLGFELIEVLVEQLDGEKTISSDSTGTAFEIRFKA